MSTTMVMTVEQIAADRNAWLEKRRTGIGGSDASIIAGLNKRGSLWELWVEKTEQLNDVEKERIAEEKNNNEFIYWGTKMEALIADRFCELTGKKVKRCGMLRSNEHPFMIADIDRLVIGENAILECKTTASWLHEEWKDDELPDAYYCQVQHYMAVGGYDKCYVACLIGGNKFVLKEVERNEEDIAALIEVEEKFWNENVVAKGLPTVDGTDDCRKGIEKHFKGGGTEAMELDGEVDILCKDIEELKQAARGIDTAISEKENKIRVLMGNAEFGRSPKYNVWYKSSYTRTTFNSKQFEKDFPDMYEKYKKVTTYRKLIIKESKMRKGE